MRTLIVDDEEDMRVLIRATIDAANQGLEVGCEARSGEEAVAAWRTHHPDVIVLDQRMPGISGLDAAEQILKEDPSQPIILFSAYLTDTVRQTATALGIRACMSKEQIGELPAVLWTVES